MRKALLLALILGACAGGPGTGALPDSGGTTMTTTAHTTTSRPATTTPPTTVTTTTIDTGDAAVAGCRALSNSIDRATALTAYQDQLRLDDRAWDEVVGEMRFLCPSAVSEALDETAPIPPTTARERRAAFLAELEAAGWLTYEDPVIGWSILYPPDWNTTREEPGANVSLQTPTGALFMISAAQDALDDEGSRDYLQLNVEYFVDEGLIRVPDDDAWFWVDHDFDEERGLFDIEGVETSWAFDFSTGDPLPDEATAPTWRYAYYDPRARPAYSFIMQTVGIDPQLFAHADNIALSFTPPPATVPGTLTPPVAPPTSRAPIVALEVGACFDDPDDWSELAFVEVVDCDRPHDNEVFAVFEQADGDEPPGSAELAAHAERSCQDRFEAFAGISYARSELYVGAFWPSEAGWTIGDRTVTCFVYEGDLSKIEGSLSGAGR